MDSYHVTGKLEAKVMVEVSRTDIVTWKWFEFEADVYVAPEDTDPDVGDKHQQAARAAEIITLRGYDVETSCWISGPHIAAASAPSQIWGVCPQCEGKGSVWSYPEGRPTFGACPDCRGDGCPIVGRGGFASILEAATWADKRFCELPACPWRS